MIEMSESKWTPAPLVALVHLMHGALEIGRLRSGNTLTFN
jgi:hypothetical protein